MMSQGRELESGIVAGVDVEKEKSFERSSLKSR